MKIVLISFNDTLGGAGIVTYRLMNALRDLGHEAEMLVANKYSNDPHVHRIGNALTRNYAFFKERANIFLHNGFSKKRLFMVSTGENGVSVTKNRYVREADAILINWICQGTLSLDEIGRLLRMGKRIVWTMHDMWCMTGICHHPRECRNFCRKCGTCFYLGKRASRKDLSYHVWHKKHEVYNQGDIKFVAVSNWVKNHAMESMLLSGKDVTVIPNAFPSEKFPLVPDNPFTEMTRPRFKKVITFGASNLDDPIKGTKYAVEALNIFGKKYPEVAAGAVAVFFGKTEDGEVFNNLKFPHVIPGTLTDFDTIQQLYICSDVVLSTSLYETLGGTLIEGMSCGAVPVSFGEGGQSDIIDHLKTGYIAKYLDPEDVADGIKWAMTAGISREMLHDVVKERFDSHAVAKRYIDLISK